MGIKLLNKFLRKQCKKDIQLIHLSKLKDKTIVIDISIYLYRFKGENALIENIYHLCSIFKYYQIKPIFIFDGDRPEEKTETLQKRSEKKKEIEKECDALKKSIEMEINVKKKEEMENKLTQLKKNCVRVNSEDIYQVQNLLKLYGMPYIIANGEADILCCYLVKKNLAYACLSEDTDMFVYGCTRVLRYFSIIKHNVVLYNYTNILNTLDINSNLFQQLCIFSGTDYNTSKYNIYYAYKILVRYNNLKTEEEFYDWLLEKYIDKTTYDKLNHVKTIFKLNDSMKYDIIQNNINNIELEKFLTNYSFVFT
uniref:XPG N-terminal domain-containing protein n=1 Tax=viral metagenome TaxID=1070528 RepID=A0A6C0CQU7_9ZZZZ